MPDALPAVEPGRPGRRRRPRRQWRDGGSSVAAWDLARLGGAVSALGVGALGARAAATALPVETADGAALVIVWLALAVPVVLAFRRSRPRGLLRFRVVDLAYGVVFGILLRGVQGSLEGLGGQPPAWPSTFSTGEGLPTSFVWQAATGSLVTPVVEEAFFRTVVLVSTYEVARRLSGRVAGAVAAVATSTALFVIAHQLVGSPDAVDLVVLASVGIVTGTLVTGTGRLWPAVAVHVVFNASGFAMIAAGTLLA